MKKLVIDVVALITFGVFSTLAASQSTSVAPAAAQNFVRPNANLFTQGIPDLPQSIADRVQLYNDFRGFGFVAWHPVRRQMLVSHRKGAIAQLFLVSDPLATPVQLTDFTERVNSASFEPREGKYLVFERAIGGNEVDQIYRMDLATKVVTLLSNPEERHDMGAWNHAGSALLYSSLPIDRTAQGGTRATISTTLRILDPLKPENARIITELPGGGWWGFQFSPDDKDILSVQYKSAAESEIWLISAADGQRVRLLPEPNSTVKATHYALGFSIDGAKIYLNTNREGEFGETMVYDRQSGQLERLADAAKYEVSGAAFSKDRKRLVSALNVDGASELQILNIETRKPISAPQFPVSTVGQLSFHSTTNDLAFSVNSSRGPSDIYVFSEATNKTEKWTQAYAPAGIDLSSFGQHSVIRWKSFDNRMISGLRVQPPAKFVGKRPVLIRIHGGPEGQSRPGFLGQYNYLVNELGIVVIDPNVRGSTGYGKSFLSLDDGYKREDSVKDIGALLDWIAQQPDLDANRVMVMGGSYGGYMSLASAVFYSDRIAGAIDIVGISHFVTFLESTESYRRDLRRVEYGDERETNMRAFLNKISPLTNAKKITAPLFVIQGKNDPRVPFTEAEQIVAQMRDNKVPIWYLRADNEGHGFVRKENADFQFYAMLAFIQNYLLK